MSPYEIITNNSWLAVSIWTMEITRAMLETYKALDIKQNQMSWANKKLKTLKTSYSLLFSPKKWDLVGLIFFIFLAAIKMTREGAKNMWAHKTSLPGWDCHMAPPTILFLWERVVKILHLKWRNSFHKSVFLALLTTTHYIFKQQYCCSVMHELWAKKVFKSDIIFHP